MKYGNCKDCVFFRDENRMERPGRSEDWMPGVCVARAPQLVQTTVIGIQQTAYPKTYPPLGCGDHQPIPVKETNGERQEN